MTAEEIKKQRGDSIMKKRMSILLAIALLIMSFTACAASAPKDMAMTESSSAVSNGYYEEMKEEIRANRDKLI